MKRKSMQNIGIKKPPRNEVVFRDFMNLNYCNQKGDLELIVVISLKSREGTLSVL